MQRPVYCYAWLPGRPNCHPVHTMKHIGMVEQFEKQHVTMLSWSMMGSGSISLPFLQRQIDGEIPPSLRFHGYMNDREFNEECLKRGILPYAVVYQAQSWEFPVVLNENKDQMLQLNALYDHDAPHDWYGMREFNQDTYPGLFPQSFKDYFPDGLTNSLGEPVTDLWEEVSTRRLDGEAAHSGWLEVEGMWTTCHGSCRNNPVWREYLKKNVEVVIDGGARAVQLDECEPPICSFGYGGCFCKDCTAQFREYLLRLKDQGELPQELADTDLTTFDYGQYLRNNGYHDWPKNYPSIPFSRLYWDFMVETHNKHFREIIQHVKEYGRKKGQEIMVSGNFTNMHLLYLPCLDDVDCCITELRRTLLRRHNWYRLAVGYTGEKPLILAESPYDEFIPKFVQLIREGKGDDYYRLFMMEAAAHGTSMAMPHGAWMGRENWDTFYPPKGTDQQIQDYLYHNDHLFGKRSGANVLVLYGARSYGMRDWQCGHGESLVYSNADDLLTYQVAYSEPALPMPFNDVTQALVDHRIPFDVQILGDDRLVPDKFDQSSLAGYDLIIVPDNDWLTENQTKLLETCGKPVYVFGAYAQNQPAALSRLNADHIVSEITPAALDAFMAKVQGAIATAQPYAWDNEHIYIQQNLLDSGRAFHLLNYAFDAVAYHTIPQDVTLTVPGCAAAHIDIRTLDGTPIPYERLTGRNASELRLKLSGVPAYCAVVLVEG